GLPIVNLAVCERRSESPTLDIVPEELAAKQTVAYREAPGVADVKGVLEDSRIGIAVVLEFRVADRDGFAGVGAGEDAFLVVEKGAVLNHQQRPRLGDLIADAGTVTAQRAGNRRSLESQP